MTNNEYYAALAIGARVWCTFAELEAGTADGFCQYCGSTSHEPLETVADYAERTSHEHMNRDTSPTDGVPLDRRLPTESM